MKRNVLRNSNYEGYFSFDGFLNRLGCLVSWDVDGRCIRLRPIHCLYTTMSILLQFAHVEAFSVIRTVLTEGKTGSPKCSPSTPGFTPPTILVPHARDSFALAVAWN